MASLERLLGSVLRHAREKRGWSQEALAEAANLDRSYLGEVERGQVSASLATLNKLSRALAIPLSDLLRRCERPDTDAAFRRRDGDRP